MSQAHGIQLFAYHGIAKVKEVDLVTVGGVPTLSLTGEGFVDVSSVRINDVLSPAFYTVGARRMLAEVPANTLRDHGIVDVEVLTGSAQDAEAALLSFDISRPRLLTDWGAWLVQRVLSCLLSEPGSDRFDPGFGVGLRSRTGLDNELSRSWVSERIQAAAEQIQDRQPEGRIPPSGRLRSLRLDAIDRRGTEVAIRIQIARVSGEPLYAGAQL